MKFHYAIILIPIFLVIAYSFSGPSNSTTQEEIKQAILSDKWIFKAQSANPQGGRTKILTSEYEMRTAKDTIICYLPYFGRSYSGAAAMSNENPLDFKSTNFKIDKEEKKKGGWKVTIKYNEANAIRNMIFELYENGSANLNVTLNDRTPITFLGTVRPLR